MRVSRRILFSLLLAFSFIALCILHTFTRNLVYSNWTYLLSNLSQKHPPPVVVSSLAVPSCPLSPDNSIGAIEVDVVAHSWAAIERKYVNALQPTNFSLVNSSAHLIQPGTHGVSGLWSPATCQPAQLLAIVIPFRDRDEHLRIYLNHMHAFLQHQNLAYTIFIVEQLGDTLFNRAALFNAGFIESHQVANYDCFIFHDVDLLPQNDRIPYRCEDQPVHLSVAVDKFSYRLPYAQLFGGAVAMSRSHIERVRGFSNCFFGWGGEDDDMYSRLTVHGYKIKRHNLDISRYMMLKHEHEKLNQPNPIRGKLLKSSIQRIPHDGYPETRYRVATSKLAYGGLFYRVSIYLEPNQTSPDAGQVCQ